MALYAWTGFILLSLFVIKLLLTKADERRLASTAREQGCKPAPEYPRPVWDILSFIVARDHGRAVKNVRFVERLVGMYDTVCRLQGRPVRTLCHKTLGTLSIGTRDPENIKAILATQFNDFTLAPIRTKAITELLGEGIFVSTGPTWAHHRALLRPSFTRDQINDLAVHEKHMQLLMRQIQPQASGWTDTIDLQPLFFAYTLDHATEFLFGESSDSLSGQHAPGRDFGENLDFAMSLLGRRLRFYRFYHLYRPFAFRKACKACHDYLDSFVYKTLAATEVTPDDRFEKAELEKGGKYIFLHELTKQTRNPTELRSNILNILMAGRDTTAALLGYLFALLARHPAIFAKLRKAIIDDFGDAVNPRTEITFTSLKSCTYLQHTLNEVPRLRPVVPANSRLAARDTTLPRGGGPDGESPVFVPKNTQITYLNYGTENDAEYWGGDVNEFRPERFDGRKVGFEHLPFNAGPRICLGQQLALTSAGFVTVKLLQRFDEIENMDPEAEVRQSLALTSRSANGAKVRLHEAE